MTIQAFRLGAVGQDSVVNTKVMCARAGSSEYQTFESPVGTDYQVTNGYTLYITKIVISTSGSICTGSIGYGDDGVGAGGTPPTNWKQLTTSIISNASNSTQYDVIIPIPSQKYPCVLIETNGGSVTIFGVEIAD
jgi:hypothetical protein